jgi:hypothetical protein
MLLAQGRSRIYVGGRRATRREDRGRYRLRGRKRRMGGRREEEEVGNGVLERTIIYVPGRG